MTARELLDRGVAAVARTGAALRGTRLLHPAGVTFEGTFSVTPAATWGVPLLDEPGEYRALVRLSKATSTPPGRRDVLGLAWRVFDAGGPGVPVDVALSSTGRAPLARHLLVPKRDFADATFTSLLPYRIGARNRYLAAIPEGPRPDLLADVAALPGAIAARPFVLSVMVADLTGPWRAVAALRVERPGDADPAFDVVANALPGFAPAGLVNRLRGPLYRGSQRGRG
ncbi:catalase family protein [Actinophytocola sp. KF-1]